MLYEQWRKIAAERIRELALHDLASGRRWTFGELLAAGETFPIAEGDVAFLQGHSQEFILGVLAAWRSKRVVCPLEPGQVPPSVPSPLEFWVHLKTTSATTGAPRLIAFTAEQLAADAENIVATMGLRPDWPNVGVISLAHSYGFSNLVLPLLLHGIPLTLVPAPLPDVVRQAIASAALVTLPAVPALWRTWHEAGVLSPRIRLAISAGAPLSARLEESVFRTDKLKIHNFYGSSECGGIAYDAGDAPRSDGACVGTPLRNVALSVNPDGFLSVCSRAVGETYWPERTADLGHGHFHTSDLVELRDGLVYLRGRISDLINVAGRKVSPAMIEQTLLQHGSVRDCLVFGLPGTDADRGDRIAACVVVAPSTTPGDLRQFLLERLPAWQVPREWRFVESMGTNLRGKISRTEWRNRFLNGDLRVHSRSVPPRSVVTGGFENA